MLIEVSDILASCYWQLNLFLTDIFAKTESTYMSYFVTCVS